ncbi:UNVERIFIED_CONTAM: hypothetical protein Scaly_2811400 [Sesamum calycinum]|uniref:Reverse transcriptase n=1 Tax=Sesamum calycinum TaxID=2727403 RepID=A0AAW2IV14_9LAMI
MIIRVETNWRKPLLDYLGKDILSADEREATHLKSRAARDGKFKIGVLSKENNDSLLRGNLDRIEKVREDACIHAERYKQRVVNAYNQRVKRREFQVGDLVLRRAGALRPVGKLAPNWEDPYKVSRISKFGAYELEDVDGRKLSRPWNTCNLRKFYP